jgi:hypothetical protein
MGTSFRSLWSVLTMIILCAPPVRAQATNDEALAGVHPRDSIRVWARGPQLLTGTSGRILWHRTDSFALSSGPALPFAGWRPVST